jgi:hypothetical protein
MHSCFFQPLENRALLSATVHTTAADNPQLVADRLQLKTDIQQYVTDSHTMQTTLAADKAVISADQKAVHDAQKSAKAQLELDRKAMNAALKADALASKPVHDQFYPILTADMAAIKADHENPDQLALDQTKLSDDLTAFHTANAPFETQTHSDIAHWTAVLAADKSAIDSAGGSSSDKLDADKAKLKTDAEQFKQLLKTDQTKINADNKQIKLDRGSNEPERTQHKDAESNGHK